MESNAHKTLRNLVWGLTVVGSVAFYSGFNYLSDINNNSHYAEKSKADVLRMQEVSKLISNPEYQNYLKQRQQIYLELSERNKKRLNWESPNRGLEDIAGVAPGFK